MNFTLRAEQAVPEAVCLDVHEKDDFLVVIGCADGTLLLIDISSQKVLYLKQHH